MNHKNPRDSKTARRMKAIIYWLILGIGALIAILFIVFDRESSVAIKVSAVGASLLSAVIFGILLALYNWVSESHLEDLLRSIFHEYLLDMVRSTSRLHVPSKEYPPTDNFDSDFMLDLMDDLSGSLIFLFRGSSGKWVAPYIKYCERSPQEIKIIILDPDDNSAISQCAADRMRTNKNAKWTIENIADEIKREINMAFVSLYDARHKSQIEIFLSGYTASPVGIDLTDEAVYVGLQVMGTSQTARIPMSYRYEKDSLIYKNYHIELIRQSRIARNTITFDCNSNKKNLKAAFEAIGMHNITDDEIKKLRQDAAEFEEKFFTKMKGAARCSPN